MNSTAPKLTLLKPSAAADRVAAIQNDALNRAARAYSVQCANKAKLLETQFIIHKLHTWAELSIEDMPLAVTSQPMTFVNLKAFLSQWTKTAEARFKHNEAQRRAEVAAVSTKFTAATTHGITKVGRFHLRPRQKKCIDAAIDVLYERKTSQAVVIPLEGGEGKSVICWGLVSYAQQHQFFGHPTAQIPLPNQAIFSTAAAVQIDMTTRGMACGIPNMGRHVSVISHTKWATKDYAHFFRTEVVEAYGQKTKVLRYIMPPPAILVIDECDAYKNPRSRKSKYLRAIIEAGVEAGSVFIFASATPWVTINDTWLFCLATGRQWQGERISMDNFPSMARAIASRAGTQPSQPSKRAMEEFRKEFNDCFVVPPRDPRTVKAYNDVMLLDFESPKDKAFYDRTMDRYYEELERVQQGATDINPMTAFLKLRQSEEWLKAQRPYFPRLMYESWKAGKAPVCGLSFEASVNEVVRSLVVDYGIPRAKISVIQGGSEILTREKIEKIIGPEIFSRIGEYVTRFYPDVDGKITEPLSPTERTAVRKYLKWIRERVKFEESEGAQRMRQDELMKLGLGKQTLAQRHGEKERFQNGETEFMVFTLSSGGRGIDMDQQFPHVRPREGFFTICYWAEEFMQALYRLMRVATLSDVHQHSVFFANTMVANHVAPRLDRKIKSVRAGVAGTTELADETIDLLAKRAPVKTVTAADLRDGKDTEDDVAEGFDPDAEAERLAAIEDEDDDTDN